MKKMMNAQSEEKRTRNPLENNYLQSYCTYILCTYYCERILIKKSFLLGNKERKPDFLRLTRSFHFFFYV
jgi:hypothetical protein